MMVKMKKKSCLCEKGDLFYIKKFAKTETDVQSTKNSYTALKNTIRSSNALYYNEFTFTYVTFTN